MTHPPSPFISGPVVQTRVSGTALACLLEAMILEVEEVLDHHEVEKNLLLWQRVSLVCQENAKLKDRVEELEDSIDEAGDWLGWDDDETW